MFHRKKLEKEERVKKEVAKEVKKEAEERSSGFSLESQKVVTRVMSVCLSMKGSTTM